MSNKLPKIIVGILSLSLFIFVSPQKAEAAGSTLELIPSESTVYLGNTFIVNVRVDSPDIASNTYGVYLTYAKDRVRGVSVSKGGSICAYWVVDPSPDNNNGRVDFECGLSTPGFKGNNGKLISITYEALKVGTANFGISSNSVVYANDGVASDLLSQSNGTSVEIVDAPVVAQAPAQPKNGPTVTSKSHPKQAEWYSQHQAKLAWDVRDGAVGYSYNLDNKPNTTPDDYIDTEDLSTVYENLPDGIWYFHIKTSYPYSWSNVTHFRIQVDTTPPEDFIPEVESSDHTPFVNPFLAFSTTDAMSGVDRYEVQIDNGEFILKSSPYELELTRSGYHRITVKAIDMAGNETIGKVTTDVEGLLPPVIDPDVRTKIIFGEELEVFGTAAPRMTVRVYFGYGEDDFIETMSDPDGRWRVIIPPLTLMPGKVTIWATAVDPVTGLESADSQSIIVEISLNALRFGTILIPWWLLLILLLFMIFILILLILFLWRFFFVILRRKFRDRLLELKRMIHRDFERIEGELDETVEEVIEKQKGLTPKKKKEIEEAIEEATHKEIDDEEIALDEEIDDIRDDEWEL